MTAFLLDTHIWFWYLVGSERLPAGLRQAIEESPQQCRLSPISVWELGMLVEKGRVRIDRGFRSWVELASELLPLREARINREVALRSLEVELVYKDPADRLLAATALTYDLTLLTLDRRLAEADWLPTQSE
jgi:PIN domain nuclease of toxin-antitoxin system